LNFSAGSAVPLNVELKKQVISVETGKIRDNNKKAITV
jgi:hypothetical protein